MRIRGIYNRSAGAGRGAFYDKHSNEHVQPWAPVTFYDDFIGQAYDVTHNWTEKETGSGTVALIADSPSGYVACALAVTGEKEEAIMYPNDFRNWVIGQGMIFEARVRLQVLPTLVAEAYIGMAGDYVEGIIATDGPAEHALFVADGSGAIVIDTDDTATDTNNTATGVTATAAQWKVYRIDFTDTADVRFYIDGAAVGTAVTHDMSNDDTLKLQPYIGIHKESGAGLGTVWVDYVRMWQNRE